jgi:two-component system chemotaxis sensor kinase CheA
MSLNPSRYAELFLTESRDNLAAVNAALLRLEEAPGDAAAIDALFRSIHTVKGMAGVMGYAAVVDLAHDLETLLAQARDGARPLSESDAAVLFEAADALENAIELSVAGRVTEIDVTALCQHLRDLARTGNPAMAATAEWEIGLVLPSGDGVAVHVKLAGDAPLRGARAMLVLERARALGKVLAVTPDEAALQAERFAQEFAIRLVTEASDDEISAALRSAGWVEAVSVRREAPRSGGTVPRATPVREGPAPAPSEADTAWAAGTLKAPLQRYVRIDVHRLDGLMNLIGELVIARGRLSQIVNRHPDLDLDEAATGIARLVAELQEAIMASRLVPVWQVFDRFPRVVRDAARSLGKEIDLVIEGREIELDRSLLEQMGDPLVHALRNAVDHGIETPEERSAAGKPRRGRLTLSATRDRAAVVIRITDDGRGIDRERVLARARAEGAVDPEKAELTDDEVLRLIARPGFSTAERVTNLSGRGVGVDAVVNRVRALGGSVELRSTPGQGTTLSIRLPVTLAIIPALLAQVASETYALPLTHVRETLQLGGDRVRQIRGRDVLVMRDGVLPLLSLRTLVSLPARDAEGSQVVVLEVAERRAGLVVDQLLGQQEIVVKPFDGVRGAATPFSGATILTDGAPALILEATSLFHGLSGTR